MTPWFRRVVRPVGGPVWRGIERAVIRMLHAGLRSFIQLTPITEFKPDDVFIVGFPRSGNTWFQNLVAGVIWRLDPRYAPDTLIQEVVPDVHFKRFYKRLATPMFFKSHELPRPIHRRVVYLLRDGRDAMVSYYHFNRVRLGQRVDLRRMVVNQEHVHPCKWHEHVDAWRANPYGAEMITIRYEDLTADPVRELQRFCAFAGVARDREFLQAVAEGARFEHMRSKEIQFGWDGDRWPGTEFFVRRGVVGSHRDEMPDDLLELFTREAGPTLSACGYV
jgi:hypothetical protein